MLSSLFLASSVAIGAALPTSLFLASSIAIARALPILSLPGLAEMPAWKMDSGYVTYKSPMQQSQHHTFVWIAESQNDASTDPILFWSNGGPGCSGLFGMGFENGPFQAQSDGGLLPSAYAWNKRATVVWFEQPAGVGFSYSDNPADYNKYNDTVSATDNAAFLTAFFAAYPKYQSLPLFLTSESYGGNYIPQLASTVLKGADTRLASQLKRGGFAVGNPVFSIDEEYTFAGIMNVVTADILLGHALLPLSFAERYRAAGCDAAVQPAGCDALTTEMFTLTGHCWGDNTFDGNGCGDDMYSNPYGNASLGLAVVPSQDVDANWEAWLNRPDVQNAIHAKTPRAPWSSCSDIGYDVTWPSSIPDYTAAFEAGLKVLVFSGDVDVTTCPFASTQVAVDALSRLPGGEITRNWTNWRAEGVAGNQTAGYFEEHKAFAFATIKAGGHEAPGYAPLASFELINAFIEGRLGDLAVPPVEAKPKVEMRVGGKKTQGSILRDKVRKTRRTA